MKSKQKTDDRMALHFNQNQTINIGPDIMSLAIYWDNIEKLSRFTNDTNIQ